MTILRLILHQMEFRLQKGFWKKGYSYRLTCRPSRPPAFPEKVAKTWKVQQYLKSCFELLLCFCFFNYIKWKKLGKNCIQKKISAFFLLYCSGMYGKTFHPITGAKKNTRRKFSNIFFLCFSHKLRVFVRGLHLQSPDALWLKTQAIWFMDY